MISTTARKRVLILGGGFGGLHAALQLEKTLARDPDIEVTLVNRVNFFLFTPLLHKVAVGDLDATHIVNPIRKLLRRVQFFCADVESIDLAARRVVVSFGDDHHRHELEYDHLVLAMGSVTNFYNVPGLQERALTMKSLGDAVYLRHRLIGHLEEADCERAVAGRERPLTVVVAGGGFAGVETMAAINDFLREALGYYPHLGEDDLRLVLVHSGAVILPELGEKLGAYAQQKLAERKVEIRTDTKVTGVTGSDVQLSDGTAIDTDLLLWTAGTSPHPLLASLPCHRDRGRVGVNEYLEVPDWPGVWAVGDCALIPDRRTGKPCPPTAQHAIREGKVVAQNITAAIQGRQKQPLDFSSLGQLAAIGRGTGVASIRGMNFSGFAAWWLWRTVYLMKLPRFEKKLRVVSARTLDRLFSKDLAQSLTLRAPSVFAREEGAGRPAAAILPSSLQK
jgi:NADH dehydrogenase